MDTNQFRYLTLIPQLIMDDSITEYNGFNPDTNQSEPILIKKDGDLWIHSSVYSLLEENEVMDDLLDVMIDERLFKRIIIFDGTQESIIRLDY